MEKIWADMYAAAKGVLAPREVSRFVEAGRYEKLAAYFGIKL